MNWNNGLFLALMCDQPEVPRQNCRRQSGLSDFAASFASTLGARPEFLMNASDVTAAINRWSAIMIMMARCS